MKTSYLAGLQPKSGLSPDSRPSFVFRDLTGTPTPPFLSGHDPLQLPVARSIHGQLGIVSHLPPPDLSSRKMMTRHRSIDPTSRGAEHGRRQRARGPFFFFNAQQKSRAAPQSPSRAPGGQPFQKKRFNHCDPPPAASLRGHRPIPTSATGRRRHSVLRSGHVLRPRPRSLPVRPYPSLPSATLRVFVLGRPASARRGQESKLGEPNQVISY
jgi:hypothetical protein